MSQEIKGADVLVVGGGVIGCAVARELALRGVNVTLLERSRPGGGATWAAAGMLTPQGEGRAGGPFLTLCMDSLGLYPEFAGALHRQTGYDPGFRPMGTLVATRIQQEADALRGALERHRARGAQVSWIDPSQIRQLAPAIHPDVLGGLWYPGEGQVDNRALGRALWDGAVRAGARVLCDAPVVGLRATGGTVSGVDLADGRSLQSPTVVICGGAWSGRLKGLPRPLPVRPVRGQMLALETVPSPLPCLLSMDHVYLVPRTSGHTLIGATLEEVGFADHTTAAGVNGLLSGALDAVPALDGAPLAEVWSGLRPGTPDELPFLGPDPEVAGLVYGTGHFRNGILLTPITAQIVADVVIGVPSRYDLAPYRADRFESSGSDPSP